MPLDQPVCIEVLRLAQCRPLQRANSEPRLVLVVSCFEQFSADQHCELQVVRSGSIKMLDRRGNRTCTAPESWLMECHAVRPARRVNSAEIKSNVK